MKYLIMVVLAGLLTYLGREVWTPFVLAAAAAFILNPLIDFLAHKIKLPRTLSIILIYSIVIGFLVAGVVAVGRQINEETREFSREANFYLRDAGAQIKILPEWLQPVAFDVFDSARQSLLFPTRRMVNFLPGALNRSISVLVFLVATFYFLKDGQELKKSFLSLFSKNIHDQLEIISQKINKVLGDYLRGQILLVIIMAVLTYLGLQIVGVRYALILSVFTGFAEIIPFVGPLAAAGVA
ncbi:AI-2E family transporter, partial [Candidatus Gottesmanbacteria bacterium]|nr:AI-2E family transporter [Candidatus Gottesmanbacteria bacterium]